MFQEQCFVENKLGINKSPWQLVKIKSLGVCQQLRTKQTTEFTMKVFQYENYICPTTYYCLYIAILKINDAK